MFIGYINSRGAIWINDGSNQKELSDKYIKASNSWMIFYPHTASVLKYIADDYLRESKSDHLHSEIDP